ncbi:MAG: BON domain-containing protein [Magnetococcales bacterium]|nr:BON domain-containing protein [Magnetococcales bacterium]
MGQTTVKVVGDQRRVDYQVTDEVLAAKIFTNLQNHATLGQLVIWAYVFEGHVFLIGEKTRPEDEVNAEAMVRAMEGVRSVEVYLLDKKGETFEGVSQDMMVTARVKAAIFQDPELVYGRFAFKTMQNHVFIMGVVASQQEADRALSVVGQAVNTRKIISLLLVREENNLRRAVNQRSLLPLGPMSVPLRQHR